MKSKNIFSNPIQLIGFLILIIACNSQTESILNQNCLKYQTPQKFGILTTTYIRSNSTVMINNYLKRYAESTCDIYDNIYIIWNNQETPQQMGMLKNKDKWKKNVYFLQTIQNSLDFKYIVPTWAKQKIFFSMDDDFDITCQTLKAGFKQWQNSAYGQIGPLSSFYGRSYVFDPKSQSFTYIDQIKLNKNWNYYHFGLTGISFISRHFLDLYYADLVQFKQMRKHVVQKFNCQDLLLNFAISHLYPQIIPQYIQLPFKSLGIQGVSSTKKHKQYRAECISKFSQILGYNPIRFVLKNSSNIQKSYKHLYDQECFINYKLKQFDNTIINKRAYYMYIKQITPIDNEFVKQQNLKLVQAKKNIQEFMIKRKQQIKSVSKNEKIKIKIEKGITENDRKMLQNTQMDLHFNTQSSIQNYFKNINQQSSIKINNALLTKQNQQLQNSNKNQQMKSNQQVALTSQNNFFINYQYSIYLFIFLSVILAIFGVKKIVQQRRQKYHIVPITITNQF